MPHITEIRFLRPCIHLTKALLAKQCYGVQVGTPSQYKAARSGNAGGIHYGAVCFHFDADGEVAGATVADAKGATVRQLVHVLTGVAQGEGVAYEMQSAYEAD